MLNKTLKYKNFIILLYLYIEVLFLIKIINFMNDLWKFRKIKYEIEINLIYVFQYRIAKVIIRLHPKFMVFLN